MNWQKISIGLINVVMALSLVALIFSVVAVTQIAKQGDNGRIQIGKFIIDDQNKYTPDENLQLKIKNPELSHTKLRITHASLYISGDDININWSMLYMALRLGMFLYSLYLVREVIRSAKNPFTLRNVKRLKIIGILLILGSFIEQVESLVAKWFVQRNYEMVGLRFYSENDFNLSLIIAGLFMIVIAQVFKYGIQMKEEQELTI